MKTKEKLLRNLLHSVSILVNEKEEDIINDYGSVDNVFDLVELDLKDLKDAYYKLSYKEAELLKTVIKV